MHYSLIVYTFSLLNFIIHLIFFMKTKINVFLTGTLLTILIIVINFSCNNNENSGSGGIAIVDSAALKIERGKYLAMNVSGCMDCHSKRDFTKFSGPVIEGTEGMGGEMFDQKFQVPGFVYARNLTPDTLYGIGKWTDDEIARTITRGIKKNGDSLFPIMPYAHYNQMSKEDVYSIIAFLRTLKPNNNQVPDRKLFVPMSVVYPPLKSNSLDNNVKPDVTDMVAYGGYMANIAACMDCHTEMVKGSFKMDELFAGGFAFDLDIFKVNSANITPDSAAGIGKWTEEMFLDKFKHFRDPASYSTNPGKANSIMPWVLYAQMDDFDIKAIYRYLRTLPAVNKVVVKYP